MKRILQLVSIALLAPLAGVAGADHEEHATAAAGQVNRDPRFEFLAALAGSWTAEVGSAEMPANAGFEFRLTAGGTAVEEREMIGTPMEMVTLYHMDGADLVATHYCAMGNQPHLRAAKRVVDGTLSFACSGKPGNAASHDEAHIHAWSMRLADDGRLHYSAEMTRPGGAPEKHEVVLIRNPETARH